VRDSIFIAYMVFLVVLVAAFTNSCGGYRPRPTVYKEFYRCPKTLSKLICETYYKCATARCDKEVSWCKDHCNKTEECRKVRVPRDCEGNYGY